MLNLVQAIIKNASYCIINLLAVVITVLSPGGRIKVKTRDGTVSGSLMKSRKGKKIFAFRGIPYGRPPVGELRFRRSEPSGSWTGVLDCTRESKKCIQPNILIPDLPFMEGGEDCLYLNIYTKRLSKTSNLLPVIVYLHGGAFVVGSCEASLYGPQILLDREVILVTLNYRLGALGFLSLETEEAPGNLGLHDQFLALSWVKDNIARFGGDPDKVTLMGTSAGAMSAVCHLASPFSRGLFHRVISLSGSPASTFMHKDRSPRSYALAMAVRLGYSGDKEDNQSLLSFLQGQSAKDIVKASMMFLDWDYPNPMPWTPSVDPFSSQPFLPLSLRDAVKVGRLTKVPVMFGLCQEDGLIFTAPFYQTKERWELMRQDWTNWAPLVLFARERELTTDKDREVAKDIARFYYGEETDLSKLASDHKTLSQLTRMYSMAYFFSPANHDASVLAQAGVPVHNFVLSHPPDFTLMDMFRLNLRQLVWMLSCRAYGYNPYPHQLGTSHADDNNYIFPISPPGIPPSVVTEGQKVVQRNLLDIVTIYARDGEPSAIEGWGRVWEAVQAGTGISRYLRVDTNCTMESDSDLQRELAFWNEVRAKAGMDDWKPVKELPRVFHNKIAIKRQKFSWFQTLNKFSPL